MKNFFRCTPSNPQSPTQAVPSDEPKVTEFEHLIGTCKTSGDFMPVWERFVNTFFFVSVIQNDAGAQTKDFRFQLLKSPQDGAPCIIVSEHLSRLAATQGTTAIKELGGKLVAMLQPGVGILVAIDDGAFGIPPDQVGWLRASLQSAQP